MNGTGKAKPTDAHNLDILYYKVIISHITLSRLAASVGLALPEVYRVH